MATAKGIDATRQLAVIPTLFSGKLINYYIKLPNSNKFELGHAFQDRAGVKADMLIGSNQFIQQYQGSEEVKDFTSTVVQEHPDVLIAFSCVLLHLSPHPNHQIQCMFNLFNILTKVRGLVCNSSWQPISGHSPVKKHWSSTAEAIDSVYENAGVHYR